MIRHKNNIHLCISTIVILIALSAFKSVAIFATTIRSNASKTDSITAKSGTEFLIYPAADTLQIAGEEFWLDINVGIENNPVKSLFGVSFVLNYSNTEYIDVVSYDSIVPGNLLGSDVVFYPHLEDENGKISAGITRKLGSSGVNGYGTLVRIKYISDPNTPHRTPIHFTLSSVTANDSVGNPIELVPKDTTIWIIQPRYDFAISVTPESLCVVAGEDTNYEVSLISDEFFHETVNLSASVHPSGPMLLLDPTSLLGTTKGSLIIYTDKNTIPEFYIIIVKGISINLTHSDTVVLCVKPFPEFELRIDPTMQTIKLGQTATYQVSIVPIAGFADSVSLSISGLETLAYINRWFNPTVIFSDQTSLLTISTSILTPPGTYVFEVIGKSRTLTNKVSATLIIEPDGSILPDPFTPNGDGQNDFVIFNISGLLENRGEVVIYNFRGRQVRELSGQNRWDGKNDNGEDLPLGLYLYIVKVDGEVKASGTLTLVR